jgi:hypothetical protein
MTIRQDFENLVETLKVERDALNLKLHLASMEAKEEFEVAEKQWGILKAKAADIADDTQDTSEEFIAKAKIISEELQETYHRISQRFSE